MDVGLLLEVVLEEDLGRPEAQQALPPGDLLSGHEDREDRQQDGHQARPGLLRPAGRDRVEPAREGEGRKGGPLGGPVFFEEAVQEGRAQKVQPKEEERETGEDAVEGKRATPVEVHHGEASDPAGAALVASARSAGGSGSEKLVAGTAIQFGSFIAPAIVMTWIYLVVEQL